MLAEFALTRAGHFRLVTGESMYKSGLRMGAAWMSSAFRPWYLILARLNINPALTNAVP